MEHVLINIVQSLILIIPFHGIFLSFFFFIRSEQHPGPNFHLGLMLLALSLISIFQQFYHQFMVVAYILPYYLFSELLISPFLYMYTSKLIFPRVKSRIYVHLLIILIAVLLIVTCSGNRLVTIAILIMISAINVLYLISSLFLALNFSIKHARNTCPLFVSKSSWILIINLLAATALIACTGINIKCSGHMMYLSQIPKGFVIYYTFYKILANADFSRKDITNSFCQV